MTKKNRVEELFFKALELDPSQWEAFLADACSHDISLKQEVESLLKAREKAFDLPDKPAWSMFVENPLKSDATFGLPFSRMGGFQLIRPLGEGGMGVIYLAMDKTQQKQVAIKVIRPERVGSLEAETRFWREAETISKLRHPNIVTVYKKGKDKGVNYFVMEYIPGKGLDTHLQEAQEKGKLLPLRDVLNWIRKIAQALVEGHREAVIHRDVKPSNIRITPEGQPKLLDFSIAKRKNLTTMTLTGEFRGTPHYASPEQVMAKPQSIDARTDIFSLGVTLYEAVTGQRPFDGETPEQVFYQILKKSPQSPKKLNPSVSQDLETVILTAMEKEKKRRYQSMEDFEADLSQVINGKPVSVKPYGAIRKMLQRIGRHRYMASEALVLLILTAVLIVGSLKFSRQKQNELRIVKKGFQPVLEAMNFQNAPKALKPWFWCFEFEKNDPSGHMIKALFHLQAEELEQAEENLKDCILYSTQKNEEHLKLEAHYLFGATQLALAEKYGKNPEGKEKMIERAEIEFQQAGAFDPLSKNTLVWREANNNPCQTPRDLKVNTEHYLVHLALGLNIFNWLFLGGEMQDFKKAVKCFETVLESNPDHVMALTYLGRTYYYYARFCNRLGLIERAKSCLNQALSLSGDRPSYWIYNTLGAVALLEGENLKALEYNQIALKMAEGSNSIQIHNLQSGLGKAYARQGRSDEAFEFYGSALKIFPNDVSVRIAIAELHMRMGDMDEALKNIELITQTSKNYRAYSKKPPLHPSSFLTCARICLETKSYAEAEKRIREIQNRAVISFFDFSLASLLIITFPDDILYAENKFAELMELSSSLIYSLKYSLNEQDRFPPILLSGMGGVEYLRGNHLKAIAKLNQAIQERSKWWPDKIRDYHWIEDARDQYLLAMAHYKLSLETDEGGRNLKIAKKHFKEAEEAYAKNKTSLDGADIIRLFRRKSKEVLKGVM